MVAPKIWASTMDKNMRAWWQESQLSLMINSRENVKNVITSGPLAELILLALTFSPDIRSSLYIDVEIQGGNHRFYWIDIFEMSNNPEFPVII